MKVLLGMNLLFFGLTEANFGYMEQLLKKGKL
jgi:hypothetical protein